MRALGVTELLAAWERAYAQRPAMRALTLVAAASSPEDPDPRTLPVGERDACLLALRDATFGTGLASVATCVGCGERMELSFESDDVRAPRCTAVGPPLRVDGYDIEWRLPTSGDVAALSPDEGAESAQSKLVELCVVRAVRDGETLPASDLPPGVREALALAVSEADPQADVELTMTCPMCASPNVIPFDVASFFWEELNHRANRTKSDVHALASVYGWAERDILAMTPLRRRIYMEMVGA